MITTETRSWSRRFQVPVLGTVRIGYRFYRHTYRPGDVRLVLHPEIIWDVPKRG